MMGYETHESPEDAKNASQYAIDSALDCGDEWPEDIQEICWGKVIEAASATNIRKDSTGKFDYKCEYELKAIE
jgi:predicted DNA-binding protein with PD1-like motif